MRGGLISRRGGGRRRRDRWGNSWGGAGDAGGVERVLGEVACK